MLPASTPVGRFARSSLCDACNTCNSHDQSCCTSYTRVADLIVSLDSKVRSCRNWRRPGYDSSRQRAAARGFSIPRRPPAHHRHRFASAKGLKDGNHENRFTTIQQRPTRLVHRCGAHRLSVSGNHARARRRCHSHIRTGCMRREGLSRSMCCLFAMTQTILAIRPSI